MVVWGGYADSAENTGGRYDPQTDVWTPTSTADAPSGRSGHSAVWTGSRMIVWGGADSFDAYPSTGGRYDPQTDAWTPTSTVDAPSGRGSPTAVWTGSRMVVWGGNIGVYTEGQYFDTGGRYDPLNDTWEATSTVDVPAGRGSHTVVWTGNRMVVWGGYNGFALFQSGGRYDPDADLWTSTSTVDAPPGRAQHTAVWTGSRMIVWGGGDETSGGRYDPGSDTWTPMSTTAAPAGTFWSSAVWTGGLMIVWGGVNGHSGGRYALGHAVDDDGDGQSECDGDCLDTDPAVYAQAQELCDERDNDCDTIVDEGFPTPGPVLGLQLDTLTDLAWSAEPSADRYDAIKGDLAALTASGGDFSSSLVTCLEEGTDRSAEDAAPVPAGGGFFYLVRAQAECKSGSYVGGGAGELPGRDAEIEAAGAGCP
jgi:N-acetylneuraminic acid mutarotase